MSRSCICITKVGGSLLSSADLPRQLRTWLSLEMAAHPNTHYVLIVGGGKLVETIRDIDRALPLDAETAHWICVHLMDVTAHLLAAMLPEVAVADRFQQIEHRAEQPGATIFCPKEFLRLTEPNCAGTPLVADWSVTSDAIAGRLAVVLSADDLVLIKSAMPPVIRSGRLNEWIEDLADSGYVDQFLPMLTAEIANLRFATLPTLEPGLGDNPAVALPFP